MNVVLLGVMLVADNPLVLSHSERNMVVLKGVPRPIGSLRAEREDRHCYEVTRLRVLEIDYSRKRTSVDVRINTARPVARRADRKVERRADHEVERPADGKVERPADGKVERRADHEVDAHAGAQAVTPPEELAP